jgi:predicted ATPase
MSESVFISYSNDDRIAAESICQALERESVQCWIAPRNQLPGERYARGIADAISNAKVLLLIFSAAANASRAVHNEVELAFTHGIDILPYRIDNVRPAGGLEFLIAGRQWLDSLKSPLESVRELVTAIHALLATAQSRHDALTFAASVEKAREPRSNLPPNAKLIGRAKDVERVSKMLSESRMVTLTGVGGVGKTRLALHVATALRHRFSEGVWLVDLAQIREQRFVSAALGALFGIIDDGHRPVLSAVIDLLRSWNTLIVLDNCEHVIDEAAGVTADILRECPQLRFLATSREALAINGETIFRTLPLQLPSGTDGITLKAAKMSPAVTLFLERAKEIDGFRLSNENASAIVTICRRLDGIPLAIELTAARLRSLGLTQLEKELSQRFSLQVAGRRDAPPRQRTMYATIDWSYSLLGEPEQQMFRRIAVFPGGCSFEAAQATNSGTGEKDNGTRSVMQLVDKSLLSLDVKVKGGASARYRLLEPLRDFALAKLDELGERSTAEELMAAWCVRFATSAHAEWLNCSSRDWEARVEPELSNLRASLQWALEDQHSIKLGLELLAVCRRFWARFAPAEGMRWIALVEACRTADPAEPLQAQLLVAKAQFALALRQYGVALAAIEKAKALGCFTGNRLLSAEGRGFAGVALASLGRAAEAEAMLTEVLAVYRAEHVHQLTAFALGDLAIARTSAGHLDAARPLFEEALGSFRALQNDRAAMSVAANLAELDFAAGNSELALKHVDEALAAAQHPQYAATYLANKSAYLVALEKWDDAASVAREGLKLARSTHSDVDAAFALQHLAATAILGSTLNDEAKVLKAAQLIGFVDSRLVTAQASRQHTEQREYLLIIQALKRSFGERLPQVLEDGASWGEQEAVAAATII